MSQIDWNPLHSPYFESVAGATQAVTGIPVYSIASGVFGANTAPAPTGSAPAPLTGSPTIPLDGSGTKSSVNWTQLAFFIGIVVLILYMMKR